MSKLFEPFISEMRQEAGATRRILERVPNDKLDWRPHEKSMPLGQLARHVASIPAEMTELFEPDTVDVSTIEPTRSAQSADELVPLLDQSVEKGAKILAGMTDEQANGMWKMTAGDHTVMEVPRIAVFRSFVLNHWYHHRAQLGVYLRLLDIPVPSVYGPTADENPLAEMIEGAAADS